MSLEEYSKEKLWPILVETAHGLVLYPGHKAYTREIILQEKPETTPPQLATRLNIPLGEALVILQELAEERRLKA
jgi:hypothetical protein